MKKLFTLLFLFLFGFGVINPSFCEETKLLTATITMVPKSFYGTWRVAAVRLEGNPKLFKEKTVDVWNLSRTNDVITLYNMFNGARAQINVDNASDRHVVFTKNGKYNQKTLTDRVEMEINGNTFKGFDTLEINTYVNGKISKTERARYSIKGEKIGGNAIIE